MPQSLLSPSSIIYWDNSLIYTIYQYLNLSTIGYNIIGTCLPINPTGFPNSIPYTLPAGYRPRLAIVAGLAIASGP